MKRVLVLGICLALGGCSTVSSMTSNVLAPGATPDDAKQMSFKFNEAQTSGQVAPAAEEAPEKPVKAAKKSAGKKAAKATTKRQKAAAPAKPVEPAPTEETEPAEPTE